MSKQTQKTPSSKKPFCNPEPSKKLLTKIRRLIQENTRPSQEINEDATKLGAHLWDEIAKGIAQKMQDQLIPVINFVYHKDYPPNAAIEFLSTEYATRKKPSSRPAPLILADITFRISGGEIYHLEFQIEQDGNITLRMLEYDFQIALSHDTHSTGNSYTASMEFPHSVVIYPAGGKNLPKFLDCILLFPDGTNHLYRVPTVDISQYDLKELFANKLNMFLPFSLLRFRDRLDYLKRLRTDLGRALELYDKPLSGSGKPADGADIALLYERYLKYEDTLKKELTGFLKELILGLETEYNQEILSKQNYDDYLRLLHLTLERVLNSHPALQKEAIQMTPTKLKFASDFIQERDEALAELAKKKDMEIAGKNAQLAEKDVALAEKDTEIALLKQQITKLQGK